MLIINCSLFFLLLAGISSAMIAEESDVKRKGLILSLLELIHDPKSAGDFTTPDEQNKMIFKLLKTSCDKNGGKFAYETATASWHHYINCNDSANHMKSNVTRHQVNGDVVKSVHETCSHVPNMKECITRLRDSIEPCLEPEEHALVNVLYNVMNAMFDFTCEIDGEPIKKFNEDGGSECYRKKKIILLTCFLEIPSLRHLADSTEELPHVGIQGLAKYLPTAKNCSDIEKFQTCSVQVLKGCPHPTAAEMADLLFNKLKDAIDCKTLFKENAASTSFINGILITVLIAAFVHFV